MSLDPLLAKDNIDTSDLSYSSSEGRYNFRFNYLGDNVLALKSSGYLDEVSMREQIIAGNKARLRINELFPEKKSHLIWDMTEVNGASILSRHLVFHKLSSDGTIESVTLIGANLLVTSFIQIVSKLIPNLKFFFFKTFDEGLANLKDHFNKIVLHKPGNVFLTSNVSAYARFLELWQTNQEYFSVNNHHLKIYSRESWTYQSPEKTFKVSFSVIEGNILYGILEGVIKTNDVDHVFQILEEIVHLLGFNKTNHKSYSLLQLKKVKSISLSARKRTAFHEFRLKDKSHMVMMIPPYFIQLLLKVVKSINPEIFGHWRFRNSVEGAFYEVLNHQKGLVKAYPFLNDQLENKELAIPKSRAEMIQLIKNQHQELQKVKKHQEEQIYKILEVTGRMTWDESFVAPLLIPDEGSPYVEIFNSLSILFQDFKEIINEKTIHAQKLKESEDKYKNLIDLASDIILVYQESTIKFVNSRVIHVMGYSPEEVVGQGMEKFVPTLELGRLKEYYRRRMNGEELPWVYETEFIHKDGHKVPMSMSVGRISYENQPAAMIISRDITHKKRTDEELEKYRNHLEEIVKQRTQQLQKEISDRKIAEESDRLKSAFLSNMSHEIRTPMNAIISFSNFLKDPNISKIQHEEFINYIQSSGQSLMRLINDIIDISKIEAKQLSIQISKTSVDPILDELYKLFEETLKKLKKIELDLILKIPDRAINASIETDPYRLKQILSNLLDNAIKFTDQGSIEFGYQIEHPNIVFFVKDTGIGIPEDKTDQIFRRFGKLEVSDRNLRGTGLGLAISKNLSLLLKGNLWMESKEGEGSIFYFSLPYQTEDKNKHDLQMNHSIHDKTSNWSNKKILIAEDEDLNFKVLDIALRKTGVKITRAFNGQDAIEKAEASLDYNLVLMDIQMPILDGYKAMKAIKHDQPSLPIIAQTAFALLEEQQRCIEMGFNDYLSKPIKLDELFAKIEKHMR